MLTCSACGTDNPAGHRFCGGCGAALAALCPACGAPAVAGFRFCGSCGSALTAAARVPAPEQPAPPTAERRVCSVLFADLVGFTPLSESRDPEEVRELLSHYFDAARTVIARYGGVVEKFIGDAVMAVWGTPVATEGDAERAVRAALDVVVAVAELGAQVGASGLAARAGVVTGEVAVTLGATGEGMVAGDAVNTAARVQSAADAGTVLVDAATQRLAAAAIAFADAGEQELKGKSEPMRVWRATRVLSGVGGAQRVDGLEAPLFGRDAELRTVKELFHASAERRTPRLVLVSGPAGVGKSRLGWEFEKYIDGLAESMYWHRGRCLSYGEGVAFWALAEIVRQRFGIAEEDATEMAAAKLAARISEFVPDEAEQGYVGPRLARLLGTSFPSGGDVSLSREELFAGWRLFFERLADVSPVILLVEDAQHADAALLDFLDHLVDWARTAPIYLLLFARPELDEQRPGWASGRNRTALTLDPLDARSMEAVLEALVPGMPAAAVAAIASQAQGNPLFAVETVRSLIDRDAVVPIDGVYRLVGDVGQLSVPDSLHALLASRLDALDAQLRALVADAAVLGTSFPAEALTAVSGRGAAEVEAALTELLHRGVFEIAADRLSPQRGAYYFSQNLLRQVAYETLSRRDRKARHLAVAAHMRSTFANEGEEVSEVIARHFLDALDAVPDDLDADALRQQAVSALVRAAERAERAGARARAAEIYQAAADLVERVDTRESGLDAARLCERSATMHMHSAAYDDAVQTAERAQALYLRHGEARAAARAAALAGRNLGAQGRNAEAREVLSAAVDTLRADVDADTVSALNELAGLEVFAGRAVGVEIADEALALGQAVEVPAGLLAHLFVIRGLAHNFANRNHEAVAALEYAARLAERAGDSVNQARALLNLSTILIPVDASAGAIAARTACDLARRVGSVHLLGVAVNNLMQANLLAGDWEDADATATDALTREGLGDDEYVLCGAATLAALRGDVDAALTLAALPRFRASDDPQDLGAAAIVDLFIAQATGRPDEAVLIGRRLLDYSAALSMSHEVVYWGWSAAVRSAFELSDTEAVERFVAALDAHPDGHLPPPLRAERTLARARLLAAQQDPAAGAALAAAIDELRAVGSPFHLAHALLDQAEHAAADGDPASADLLVEEAHDVATMLGAQPLLERANAAQTARSAS